MLSEHQARSSDQFNAMGSLQYKLDTNFANSAGWHSPSQK